MFEHRSKPLLPLNRFLKRLIRNFGLLLLLILFSLLAGSIGYRVTENMSWIEAFYNASLIMSGMGPADSIQTDAGKIFASLYALYSGLFLIAAIGLSLLPFFHRMLHILHIEEEIADIGRPEEGTKNER